MPEFKIEKGVPLPRKTGRDGQNLYPWPEMEIGDSIFLPGKTIKDSNAGLQYGRAHGKKFTARSVEGGIRVWRVA